MTKVELSTIKSDGIVTNAHLLCESNEPCLKWWDHDSNDEELFLNIRRRSRKFVFWKCPACCNRFLARVDSLTTPFYPKCKKCGKSEDEAYEASEAQFQEEYNKLRRTLVSEVPQLLEAWDDDRDPSHVTVIPQMSSTTSYNDITFKFKCKNGHHSRMIPQTFLSTGCPICARLQSIEDKSYSINPQQPELLAEWDYDKNGKNTPEKTSINSKKKIAWKCLNCGYTWEESPKDRLKSYASCCPNCKKVMGSIGWRFPKLAKEWSDNNPDIPWRVRASVQLRYIPEWICEKDPSHKWTATVQTRVRGQECPYCNYSVSSKTEQQYYEVAKRFFENVESSITISDEKFSQPWIVDMLICYKGIKIIIEYDGQFWHKKKQASDIRKSIELLDAGYVVIRLRETELTPLPISDANYKEFIVHPLTIKYSEVMSTVKEFIDTNFM